MGQRATIKTLVLAGLLAAPIPAHARPAYGWLPVGRANEDTLLQRYAVPAGFSRPPAPDGSFAEYVRHLPLKPKGTALKLFDGSEPWFTPHVASIIDLDIGGRDLQQCADTIIRLHAEYLFGAGNLDALSYKFTSGDVYAYRSYLSGQRPKTVGGKLTWLEGPAVADSRAAFRDWLDIIFTYLGTASLARDLKRIPIGDARPGDLFVTPGYPGHAIMIADIAADAAGRRRFLLVEGFTPAQDAHVLGQVTALGNDAVWFSLDADDRLVTPVWTFGPENLYRLP